jgi:hypothetical protein
MNAPACKENALYLVQLPLHDYSKQQFPSSHFECVRQKLADKFGGVTAFFRSPAKGLWKAGGPVSAGRNNGLGHSYQKAMSA